MNDQEKQRAAYLLMLFGYTIFSYKVSNSKPCGNDFFAISCDAVFISALRPFYDLMETEPLQNSAHR